MRAKRARQVLECWRTTDPSRNDEDELCESAVEL